MGDGEERRDGRGDKVQEERAAIARADGYRQGYRAGAEAMRDAAVALCNSPDVTEIEEYADCISVLPIEPPIERDSKEG